MRTLNEHVAVLLDASVERKDSTVVPTGKKLPLTRPLVCVTFPDKLQLSCDVTTGNGVFAPQYPGVEFASILAGQTITGGTRSATVKVYEQTARFPIGRLSNTPKAYWYVPTGKMSLVMP